MHHFAYRDGVLHAEGINIKIIAEDVGTPFYCYSSATLERHYRVFDEAFKGTDHTICYSMKANSNQAVVKTLVDLGAGIDVVSEGELRRALALGVPGRKIVFSGIGKTAHEMALALKEGIACFNVESEPELELLSSVATRIGSRATVSIRINPDVDAKTHAKITTGTAETKFGIPFAHAREAYARAALLHNVEIVGIDVHIGSQLTDLEPFEAAFTKVAELAKTLRGDGHSITRLDLGGGLGVPYENNNMPPPDPAAYGKVVARVTNGLGCRLIFEPGRLIAANAGVLVSKVLYVKKGDAKTFLILDAGMNDLIRPAMYEAHHEIVAVTEPAPGAERVA